MRYDPLLLRQMIITTAYDKTRATGNFDFKMVDIASSLGVSKARVCQLITHNRLKQEVLRLALNAKDYSMLRHNLAGPMAGRIRMPAEVRQKVIQELAKR